MNKSILTIAKKEYSAALHNIGTYIVFAIFLLVSGVYFAMTVFKFGVADLRAVFSLMHTLFLFYIPALSMGSIAKEKSGGTLEFVSTLPIKLYQLIWGKFFAIMGLLLLALLYSLVFAIIIVIFGRGVDFGALLSGYLGLIIIGAAYTAIGVFASGLQANQTMAFILALALCGMFYVLQYMIPLLPPALIGVFQFISFDFHFQNFTKGIVDTRDLIYFGSIIYGFLLLAEFNLKSKNMMQER